MKTCPTLCPCFLNILSSTLYLRALRGCCICVKVKWLSTDTLSVLSQGLSVLILWLGFRPCASQIYPYVTKKLSSWRLPAGMRCRYHKAFLCSGRSSFRNQLLYQVLVYCFDLICFGLSCASLSNFQRFLSSAQFLLQCSDVRGLACHVHDHANLHYPFALLLLIHHAK